MLEFKNTQFPIVVLSSDTLGIAQWAIRWRTKGMYNHIMTMIDNNTFASQAVSGFKTVSKERYMTKGNYLKFIEININERGRAAIVDSINSKLNKGLLNRKYDFLGIVGQILGLKWINNPFNTYCSEDVVEHLLKATSYVPDDIKTILSGLPKHGSPEDINKYMKEYPEIFTVIHRWTYD